MHDPLALEAQEISNQYISYPEDWARYRGENVNSLRFTCFGGTTEDFVTIYDACLLRMSDIPRSDLETPMFDLPNAYAKAVRRLYALDCFGLNNLEGEIGQLFLGKKINSLSPCPRADIDVHFLQLHATSFEAAAFLTLQRNASVTRDFERRVPDPIIVVARLTPAAQCES